MKLVGRYCLGLKKQAKSSVYHSTCLTTLLDTRYKNVALRAKVKKKRVFLLPFCFDFKWELWEPVNPQYKTILSIDKN